MLIRIILLMMVVGIVCCGPIQLAAPPPFYTAPTAPEEEKELAPKTIDLAKEKKFTPLSKQMQKIIERISPREEITLIEREALSAWIGKTYLEEQLKIIDIKGFDTENSWTVEILIQNCIDIPVEFEYTIKYYNKDGKLLTSLYPNPRKATVDKLGTLLIHNTCPQRGAAYINFAIRGEPLEQTE